MPSLTGQSYYDYNAFAQAASSTTPVTAPAPAPPPVPPPPVNLVAASSSSSSSRPLKRPRPLTEEETAAITRNFTRGDFFVGNSAVRAYFYPYRQMAISNIVFSPFELTLV
jgi:hypothetical protein